MRKLTKEEQATLDFYNESASNWAGNHSSSDFWREEILRFQKLLPSGEVLEIGCGGGRDASALAEFGYDYVGTDISSGLLEIAKKANPGLELQEVSMYDLGEKWQNEFDGLWASAVLLHIPKDRINTALASIKTALKPGAIGFVAIKEGDGAADVYGDGRTTVFWQKEEFREVLEYSGFNVRDFTCRSMSRKPSWLCYFVENV